MPPRRPRYQPKPSTVASLRAPWSSSAVTVTVVAASSSEICSGFTDSATEMGEEIVVQDEFRRLHVSPSNTPCTVILSASSAISSSIGVSVKSLPCRDPSGIVTTNSTAA